MTHTIQYAHKRVLDEIQSWPVEMHADFAWIADLLGELGPRPKVPHSYAIGAGLYEVLVGGRGGDGPGDGPGPGHVVYGLAGGEIVLADAFRSRERTRRESPRTTPALRRMAAARKAAAGNPIEHIDREYKPFPHDRAEFLRAASKRDGFDAAYSALEEQYLIARTLVPARVRAGLTQAEVAQRMGTSVSAVSRLEAAVDRSSPSLSTLRKYAAAVGCDLKLQLTERMPA